MDMLGDFLDQVLYLLLLYLLILRDILLSIRVFIVLGNDRLLGFEERAHASLGLVGDALGDQWLHDASLFLLLLILLLLRTVAVPEGDV